MRDYGRDWDWIDELTESRSVAWFVIALLLLLLLGGCATTPNAVVPEASKPEASKPTDNRVLFATDSAGSTVRLYFKPCVESSVLKIIPAALRAHFQEAQFLYLGRELKACWAVGPDGLVHVADDEGDVTKIPKHYFRPEVNA